MLSGSREDARETGLGRMHGGRVQLEVESDGRRDTFEADEVLVATGRHPRLDNVGLETVGLSPEDVTGDGTLPDWLRGGRCERGGAADPTGGSTAPA